MCKRLDKLSHDPSVVCAFGSAQVAVGVEMILESGLGRVTPSTQTLFFEPVFRDVPDVT